MFDNIKKWWWSERLDRVEKDTSQDMAPRNGDVVFMYLWFSLPFIIMGLIAVVLHYGFGIPWSNLI